MKKNKMMRLASALLVAVMLTTCTISGTYAKYVSQANNNDHARVAKWGVTVKVQSETGGVKENAFEVNYLKGTNTPTTATTGVSVASSNTEKVLAPGTKGTLATYTITGKPEVSVSIAATAVLDLGDKWVVEGNEYCPLVFKVNSTEFKIDATTDTVDELEAAVNAEIIKLATQTTGSTETEYEPNSDAVARTVTVEWEWPFDNTVSAYSNDVKDTALGDAATPATINFSSSITVTQVD